MRLDLLIIGLVVISLVVVTGAGLIGDINHTYGTDISTSRFTSTYNIIAQTYNTSEGMRGHTDSQISDTDTSNSMFKGSFSAMRLVWGSFSIMGNMLNDVASALGVPSYFVLAATTILTVLVVFGVIYLVLRVL